MVVRPEQQQMQVLLTEAITHLCKNGLQYRSHFNVEGLLGITLDDEDVFLVNIKQTVKGGEGDPSINVKLSPKQTFNERKNVTGDNSSSNTVSRAKQRKRRKKSTDSIERLTPNGIPLHNNNNNVEKKNSNVPHDPKSEWMDMNQGNKQQSDIFDDSASSPGELIVVKEEHLSDNETSQIQSHFSHKKSHSKPTQKEVESNNSAIYASSNGQIATANSKSTSPKQQQQGQRTSPYPTWQSVYHEAANSTGEDVQDGSSTFPQQDGVEPDDTACLKAAYADSPSAASNSSDVLSSTASGSVVTSTPAGLGNQPPNRRKRTLDSVVKNLHNSKKQFVHEDTENLTGELSIDVSSGYITTKNINNNNVTIDTSTGLEVKKPTRKKGPFGKKRLTEIVDANANNQLALTPDGSASDLSLLSNSSSLLGTPGSADDATCHICNKVLSTKASYKRHMNFHQGIYPHRCGVCGKGFAVKGDLRGHEATHTNEKEFPCTGCDRVFAYKKNLQMHMRKKHQLLVEDSKMEMAAVKMDLASKMEMTWT